MKCKKCGTEMKEAKFCPECGAKAPNHFNQMVEAESHQKEKQKAIRQKQLEKEKRIIQEKGLKNNYVLYSFIFGLIGAALVLWPAGLEIQTQWWYSVLVVVFGFAGYFTARKARILNVQYFNRYRVHLNPRLSKLGLGLSIFSLGAGVFMGTFVMMLYM